MIYAVNRAYTFGDPEDFVILTKVPDDVRGSKIGRAIQRKSLNSPNFDYPKTFVGLIETDVEFQMPSWAGADYLLLDKAINVLHLR